MRMMQQTIEERGDGCGVAEELAPIIDGTIRRQQRRCPLVASHDDLQKIFGGRVWQLSHAEVVDDEERHGREFGQIVFARPGERRVGEVIEQRVRLPIDASWAWM